MARHVRRLILWTTGVLVSLALLAMLGIAVVIWGIDPDVYRARIERSASDALGRRVELGTLRWRPGMNFQIESRDGRIANAQGFGTEPLASWQSLRLGVALRPMLDRRLVVDRIEVQGLRLNLARSAAGVNFTMPERQSSPGADSFALAVGSFALRGGAVSFTDSVAAKAWSATSLNMEMKLPAPLDAPVLQISALSLDARVSGAPVEPAGAALRANLPRIDVDRAAGRIAIPQWQLQWNDARLGGAIEAAAGDQPRAHGSFSLNAPSLRRLLQSVSIAAPATRDAGALGAMDLTTRFDYGSGALELSGLVAQLDSTRVTGEASVPAFSPLSLRFELAADQVDADRYLSPPDAPSSPLVLPLAQLHSLDARGVLTIRRATFAGAAAREMRIDVE